MSYGRLDLSSRRIFEITEYRRTKRREIEVGIPGQGNAKLDDVSFMEESKQVLKADGQDLVTDEGRGGRS